MKLKADLVTKSEQQNVSTYSLIFLTLCKLDLIVNFPEAKVTQKEETFTEQLSR